MGRVLLPPYGDMTSNIVGVHETYLSSPDTNGFTAGEFLQFINGETNVLVKPANNRFNLGMISITDVSGGNSYITEVMTPAFEEPRYDDTVTETTAVVNEKYISAGEFVTLRVDNTLIRATGYESISGYAIDSGKFGATIRIKTL